MKQLVTSADSPFTVQFPAGSASIGAGEFNVDRNDGAALVYLPSLSDLPQQSQKVTVANLLDSDGTTTVYPGVDDSIAGGPVGSGILLANTGGRSWTFQPVSENVWGLLASPTGQTFVGRP